MTLRQNGHLSRNGLINQADKKRRTSDELPSFLGNYLPFLPNDPIQGHSPSSRPLTHVDWQQLWRQSLGVIGMLRSWRPRDLFGVPLVLILVWGLVLWWGEEVIFRRSVEDCAWSNWESWVYQVPPRKTRSRTGADRMFSLLHLPPNTSLL